MRALVSLTPSEGKRLIAKAVAAMDEVRRAMRKGTVVITRGTTTAFIVEELAGERVDKGGFARGIVVPSGLCVSRGVVGEAVFVDGVLKRELKLKDVLPNLGKGDVVVKGANALDPDGYAGVLLGGLEGGTVGSFIGAVVARGVELIIPVGLEKLVAKPLREVADELGIYKLDYSMGIPTGIAIVKGKVVTELEAIKILFNIDAMHVASGGVSGAEGSSVILLKGEDERVKAAVSMIEELKGEPPVFVKEARCAECEHRACPLKGRRDEELPRYKRVWRKN